jgi:hypothetical protein
MKLALFLMVCVNFYRTSIFGSGKSSGSLRIRIHNTGKKSYLEGLKSL